MKNLWRLLKLYKSYTGWVVLGILLSAITLLANISLMAVSGWFISAMAIAGVAGVSMNYYSPAAIIRAAAIFRTAGRYAERLVTHEATFRFLSALRVWFYTRLEPLVPAALEDVRSGDLLSHIRNDIDTLNNLYIRVIVPVSVAVIAVLLVTWVVSIYSLTMALVVLCFLLLAGLFLPWIISSAGRKPGQSIVERSAQMNTQVVESLQGMAELTVYGALEQNFNLISSTSQSCIDAQKKMGYVSGLAQSGLLLLMNLAQWSVLVLAIPLTLASDISGAELTMLVMLSLAAFESVMPLPEAFRLLGQIQTAAGRLFAILDRSPALSEPVQGAVKPETFDIDFNNVEFRYQAAMPPVLTRLKLSLPAGKKLAVVGPTGAGKSSLIQLLLRFREFQSGRITLGGVALDQYRSEQLCEWIAVVPQQVHLFNSTIRNNLLLAKADATDADLQRVCKIAQLDEFIQQQPDGLETWVGETGIKVSGGQARRIAIARALLRDFECLVLDEPGEGLDTRTERALINGIVSALKKQSLILITHSRTGLELMDEVLELSDTEKTE
jgi:ATP-binding cassette, subfamily C, bacterial CydC